MKKIEFEDVFTSNYYTELGVQNLTEMLLFFQVLRHHLTAAEFEKIYIYVNEMLPETMKVMEKIIQQDK